jgi:threonine dehydrogenase-like Zn-dependent dehydrogenase
MRYFVHMSDTEHEGAGVVEGTGKGVRNLMAGHRVVIPFTVGCG